MLKVVQQIMGLGCTSRLISSHGATLCSSVKGLEPRELGDPQKAKDGLGERKKKCLQSKKFFKN